MSSFPHVKLDVRDYQDLIDEAKVRVGANCPEWTDHNVSDPGITLIEQFAWMTDILLYRVNRIPEAVHWELLKLLGVKRKAPVAARAALRFRLSQPPTDTVTIPAVVTEVATVPGDSRPAVVFQVIDDALIPVIELSAALLHRSGEFTAMTTSGGIARPLEEDDRAAFSRPPRSDDALYLGFRSSPARLVLQIHWATTIASGTGVATAKPPWTWECSRSEGRWVEDPTLQEDPVDVLREGTGALNYPIGLTELQVPAACAQQTIGGLTMYWLRCRLVGPDQLAEYPRFLAPPLLQDIRVNSIGVLADAHHAKLVVDEEIGVSDGTPGQIHRLRHVPAHDLHRGEDLEVWQRGEDSGRWESWTRVESFAGTNRRDAVYSFDAAAGEVQLGPAVQEPEGWHRHGLIPAKGAMLKMSRYRHGGGSEGNVEKGTLTVLRTPIPRVASVSNPRKAWGGADLETLDAARHRAADELRTRSSAVTAGDFENLARRSSNRVARARCVVPAEGKIVVVRVLPKIEVEMARGAIAVSDLRASLDLREEVLNRLKACCLLGTSVHVTPVALRGVTVAVEVLVEPGASRRAVQKRILEDLYRFLNPIVGGDLTKDGSGWPWGRDVRVAELRMLVERVQKVEQVLLLRIYETNVQTAVPSAKPVDPQVGLVLQPDELIVSMNHAVRAVREGAQ